MPRVYASMPLSGPSADAGRDVLQGAERALERAGGAAPELVVIDTGDPGRDARAEDAARQAARDDDAIAYLGDFHSSQVHATQPILSAAGLLQVAPVATWVELEGPTLIRLLPDDRAGAGAIGRWLEEAGVEELLVVHDHDADYGVAVSRMCIDAARGCGLAVRSRPVWNHDERAAGDIGDAGAVLYVGVAGSGAAGMWEELHRAGPDLWLLGTEGVAQQWLAASLSEGAAERTRFFVAPTKPLGDYGQAAMELILAGAAHAAEGRAAVVGAALAEHVAATEYGCLAVVKGELVSA